MGNGKSLGNGKRMQEREREGWGKEEKEKGRGKRREGGRTREVEWRGGDGVEG